MGIFLSIEEHNLNLQEVHWERRFISIVNCAAPLGGVGGPAVARSLPLVATLTHSPPAAPKQNEDLRTNLYPLVLDSKPAANS